MALPPCAQNPLLGGGRVAGWVWVGGWVGGGGGGGGG